MNKKVEPAHAGTLESSDLFVRVTPIEGEGVEIELESTVYEIYADAIKQSIVESAKALKATGIKIMVQDKGALDYVIKARVQAAILRAYGINEPDWSVL
jgi:citrate lyase subunit gamma (acyl carrier protein)